MRAYLGISFPINNDNEYNIISLPLLHYQSKLYTMSAYTQTRPGTPYPTTDSISYFPQTSPRRMSQSIHFPLPSRPVLTPPSLLHRTSSSGSSSSYHLSKTPSASNHGRRPSTCSSSSASDCSSMPVTPQVIAEVDEDVVEIMDSNFELHLPEPHYIKSTMSKSPKTSDFSSIPFSMVLPSRPKLKRRDTPRPKSDVLSMAPLHQRQIPALPPVEESMPRRKLTSIVDGKSWLVVA